jgi:hypothetical protein
MGNLQALLKSAEESVQIVEDPELRKIAFHEVLRHALRFDEVQGGQSRPGGASEPPRATRSTGPVGVRPEVANLDLSPDQPSLVSWGTLSSDWRKFCWVLEAARLKGVDGLTNQEISSLIDKVFRESYVPKVVNNIKFQIKKVLVKPAVIKAGDREYQVWKILAGGTKEVAVKTGTTAA